MLCTFAILKCKFDIGNIIKEESNTDEDGIPNNKDKCAGTPKSIEVDNKGYPPDKGQRYNC
ncbi:MAG: hypothetical protein H7296_12355 [Bacteroidia bacterium]|nr:hypothetical protein [Bacteroidia bacterium]